MKITLLISTFNSTAQLAYTYLKDEGHIIDVVYAIHEEQMITEVNAFMPNIILSPYLKKFVPQILYEKYPIFILHPGIIGDKGAYSLDNAIREQKEEWGVVYLRANGEFDGGDIYAQSLFKMRRSYKSSLYRNEVNRVSVKTLKILLKNIDDKNFAPKKQLQTPMHLQLTQKDRKIDWNKDTTEDILTKIYMSDSYPGVKETILGVPCYLFGAHKEDKFRGRPKEILAKRDGAICLGTVDGAIWITHLKAPHHFKLPATYVLKERLKGIKEERLPLIFDQSYETFYEIGCNIKNEVAYLSFNFHNGAFSSDKCIKLKYAFEYIKKQVKIVILMGGKDFFSNGIHLNILEDSKKNGEDGWSNINAMNDLVKSVLFADDVITVASLANNAGAGGVFLALACDYVIAREGTVLNPHYKTLGLSGSEYHSYTLLKRIGEENAKKILEECLPISAEKAKNIGMIDQLFSYESYQEELENFCIGLLCNEEEYEDLLWEKEDYLQEHQMMIESCKKEEIAIMHPEFWDAKSPFHQLRYEFVYKICPIKTPKRLKGKEYA